MQYRAVEGSSFVLYVGTTAIMDLVGIHRTMWEMSRKKLGPIYFFPYDESKHHKMVLSQVRNRNLKPSVTFFAAFLVSFMHEEIWWGLWEEGKGEQLDQCWEPTGGHQHGPQRLAAQQLPGREKSCVRVHCTGFEDRKHGKAEEEAKGGRDPEMNYGGNQLHYTFVLKFVPWLFPMSKRKRKSSLQIHVAS